MWGQAIWFRIQSMNRTLVKDCLQLVDKKVRLFGRIHTIRDHGKITFVDLSDETGQVQCVIKQKIDLLEGDILDIVGTVKKRPKELVNKNLETGTVEVAVEKAKVISKSKPAPIPTDGDGYDIEEALRLRYRFLDLRRARLQKNLRLRAKAAILAREYLNKEGFVEVETPYLSKTTPEGARDFLVPSRLRLGKFYALAQAPQQYKQLLMLSGFEKYFQFARAFRDEDLRADRQFEHTQIDIEAAYVKREDILTVVEGLTTHVAEAMGKKIYKKPFPIFTYKEAIEKFKQDKFDMRAKKDTDTLAFAWVVDFPLLSYDQKEKRYTFSHNPFTAPKEEFIDDLIKLKNLDEIESYQYDLVLNGEEIGSGSIRITDPKIQRQVFAAMGYSGTKIDSDFGHLLEAYEYGAPTHGGIALGFDRFCAVLAGEKSIREIIAFPTSGSGQTSVMDAPSEVDDKVLAELGIKKR